MLGPLDPEEGCVFCFVLFFCLCGWEGPTPNFSKVVVGCSPLPPPLTPIATRRALYTLKAYIPRFLYISLS